VSSSNADQYFFQPDATVHYTYSLDNTILTDTVTYQVVDTNKGGYLSLVAQSQTAGNPALLLFRQGLAADGSTTCILSSSSSSTGYVALKGTLDVGATWFTDTSDNISATVVGKYTQYYLPGRQVHYDDVVVVKYADKNTAPDTYIVRYFARNCGLILERTITGPTTEIDNLLLLSLQRPAGANPDLHHDRWFNVNGRYQAHVQDNPFDK
jgi:hypothetical protein